ncbi:TetR/AcrR family transcriptional regulator [Pseudomonas synxantha]|uniref:Transcriptional regulator n=1 Tax=Pseudomonas synxantha TaxID=47883 RepID=A0AAX3IB77_9PSED|nr:helix-turn-helix domain-containing protein [Pseudomonas synxantha]VTR02211.1 transcriptional regulator [Pseudomonas synxantha]
MSATSPSLFDEMLSSEHSTSKQDAILAAAGRIFIQHGFEGTSMELIAKAAGVARQTLYNRFPDGKEALFGAVAERMWRAFPVMDIASDEEALANPEAGLRTIGRGVAAFWAPPLQWLFYGWSLLKAHDFPS